MPSKNKPKRLDRQRNFRVARRKRKQRLLSEGNKRSRGKRPKHKVSSSLLKNLDAPKEAPVVKAKKPVVKKTAPKKEQASEEQKSDA